MQLQLTGRNIEITPALKTFTQEKMQKVQRRDDSISNMSIVFHVENLTHIAEATLVVDGTELHATAKADDMYSAIDELVDKIITQVTKHKEKHSGH